MGYETKILNRLDKHNIDAEFKDGVLYLFESIDVVRAEDVLLTWMESDDPSRIFSLPTMCVLEECEL